jgi:esterase/lipase superfamily enzyme
MSPRHPIFRLTLQVPVITAALLMQATSPAMAQDGVELAAWRGVPYFTLRKRTGDAAPRRFYGDERGALEAGSCEISERRFDILTPVAEAAPFRGPDEILRVADLRPRPIQEVLSTLVDTSSGAAPLLHMHGFYIDFEKGRRRATALQESAGLEGRFLWFSWPSDGTLLNYSHDDADLYWSALDLAETITAMAEQFGPGRLNLAGHSLGGRGIALAIHDVAAQRPEIRLGDVVLLAPDMDFDVFARLLPRIRPIVRSITIYVADADRPLALSEKVHGHPRLGQAGNDVAQLKGVEVIDLSDLQVRSPTGHLYHVYNAEVGADMDQWLRQGLPAAARRNMLQVGESLWRLQREE